MSNQGKDPNNIWERFGLKYLESELFYTVDNQIYIEIQGTILEQWLTPSR